MEEKQYQNNNILPIPLDNYLKSPVDQAVADYNHILYQTHIRHFLHTETVKVYINRISIEAKSGIGLWENRKTYSASDMGNVFINKGRSRGIVGATRINNEDVLFQISNLGLESCEALKDALDYMLCFRQFGFSGNRTF